MDALPWRVVYEVPCPEVALGEHRFDTRHRALVMGILDRTSDVLAHAERLVADGADIIDVGGAEAGAADEELEHVIPVIDAIHQRFDPPISVDTCRASVLRAAIGAGAVVGNDSSGFADPEYLAVAAAGRASVVVTHTGTAGDVNAVGRSLRDRAERAEAAGIPHERVIVDAGLGPSKTELQSLDLLRAHDRLAELGWPVCLSAPHSAHAAHALAIALGCRILRAHDVKAARRTADVMSAILQARVAS